MPRHSSLGLLTSPGIHVRVRVRVRVGVGLGLWLGLGLGIRVILPAKNSEAKGACIVETIWEIEI